MEVLYRIFSLNDGIEGAGRTLTLTLDSAGVGLFWRIDA